MSDLKLKILIGKDAKDLEKQVKAFVDNNDLISMPQYSSHFVQGGAGKGGDKLIAYIHYADPIDVMPNVTEILPPEAEIIAVADAQLNLTPKDIEKLEKVEPTGEDDGERSE